MAGREFEVRFDPAEVRRLVADLKQLEGGRAIANGLRRNLRGVAEPIKRQVQANASWSSRIPAAVAIQTAFTARRTGVFIRVNKNKAPHARPLEMGSQGNRSTVRHPLFGNRDVWVSQPTRPFFFAAGEGRDAALHDAAADAVEQAARLAGFRP